MSDFSPDASNISADIKLAEDERRMKAQLEIQKLKLETAKLTGEARPLFQISTAVLPIFAAMVPLVTAFAALFGVWISLYTLAEQGRARTEEARTKAFQQALSMATDPKGGADQRISGIYQLRDFWSRDHEVRIVAATLTSLLLIPDTVSDAPRIRCAAADAIGAAYDKEQARTRSINVSQMLFGRADTANEGMISRQNLLLWRLKQTESGLPSSNNVYCTTPLAATREAISRAKEDLRYANLRDTNLDGVNLAGADLRGADFTTAQMIGTNLNCANLAEAKFAVVRFGEYGHSVFLANITDVELRNPAEGSFQYSEQTFHTYGGLNLGNKMWEEWRENDFDAGTLKRLLGALPEKVTGDFHVRVACGKY